MKKSLLSFFAVISFVSISSAQMVNGIPLKDINVQYIEITGRELGIAGTRINLLVNYGQPIKAIGNAEKLLLDSAGKKMEFNSLIDALNFMYGEGYETTDLYEAGAGKFLLRKRKDFKKDEL